MSAGLQRTFSSLSVPNYRRYFTGQVISISGNWMQIVAEMWLIVQLTGSGVSVGVTAALQFLPMLLFGAWGGLLADRVPKLRLLQYTQALMAVPALTLWVLTATGDIAPWMVFGLVLARGSVLAIDNPARQAFVMELVGPERIVNAVSLNSVVVHCSRIAGPAAAGAVIAVLRRRPLLRDQRALVRRDAGRAGAHGPLRAPDLRAGERARGDVRLALRHVRATPALWIPLAAMVLVGTLSFNFQVLMPLLAHSTWHGTATTYAAMTMAMGVGSVGGALLTGGLGRVSSRLIVGAAAAVRRVRAARRRGALAAAADPGAGAARRGLRDVRRGRQLVAPARRLARDARARDVALLRRLPRLDADRRPARRLARGGREPARGPRAGRRRGAVAAAGARVAYARQAAGTLKGSTRSTTREHAVIASG